MHTLAAPPRPMARRPFRTAAVVLGFNHHPQRSAAMATILPFRKPVKEKGLCQHGFHKWKVRQDKQFDVRQGKLVTIYRCERCDEEKVKAH